MCVYRRASIRNTLNNASVYVYIYTVLLSFFAGETERWRCVREACVVGGVSVISYRELEGRFCVSLMCIKTRTCFSIAS